MKDGMVIKGDWDNFLNLEGEELLFVKRRHPFIIIYPLFLISTFTVIFSLFSQFLFTFIVPSFPLFIATTLLICSFSMSLMIYSYIYWYFHLYILTTRKILEVKYTPLFAHVVNDIFLDKVNCTEIDLSSKGFFHELIDMGDLIITFDRPTHQEEFILQDVKDCDELGKFLTQKLMDRNSEMAGETIWLRGRARIRPKIAI
ncbi:MAG TPA: hypothetical protein VM077_03025 [Candidatus Limnocylindrales bacterium]|nr:hypothetical protein [Candidatus Limnocylindrales bacterium]